MSRTERLFDLILLRRQLLSVIGAKLADDLLGQRYAERRQSLKKRANT